MTPAPKKNNQTKVPPHLPSEIRKRGPVDLLHEWYVLKTVGIAVLFGFFSGFIGGIVVNTHLGEDWLWGSKSKAREYFSTSQAEHTNLSRGTLTQKALSTTVGIYRASSIGSIAPRPEDRLASAFFLTADGYLATTAPFMRTTAIKDIVVVTNNARIYQLESIALDPATDFSILKIKGNNFDVLPFVNNDKNDSGTFAWMVVPSEGLFPSEIIATGVVAVNSKDRQPFSSDIPYRFDVIKNSASAESLGSPLLNGKGEILGSLAGSKNNRSVLRAGLLKSAFDRVLKDNKITRPSLGVHFFEAAQTLNLPENTPYGNRGVVLAGDITRKIVPVDRKSPLAALGLKAGDRILAINNESISSMRSLPDILFDYNPGDRVEITYVRDNKESKKTMTLGGLNH
ncbi:MAG: HtrA protein [Candidatus Magasanikbacteria bacterium GW2011_GWC2_45_8]|uniref:HtrA protein n=1 Tax=Candidatus Magasanikbacteria bacterium GW2011_GWC2_45_8 TaxID=1619050 RepID=A0A0G1Q7P8_9BACT|nr:MAG: HtrA protein [Candidatus Magasanikbacteria bacterium GW2011_GWC2_45_8]